MDHPHGPEASISEEADPLYRPLEAPAAGTLDEAAWAGAVERLRMVRDAHPDWAAMVDRGMRLAAAHRSGALDGLYEDDPGLTLALLRGEATLTTVDDGARPHVRAIVGALRLATDLDVSEDSIRAIHEVACRPQPTHAVRVDDRVQDHVLAAGDYKHHPNHVLLATGSWQPTAPVAQVPAEMGRLVRTVHAGGFAALHPVVQADYLHHALLHVQPFADGNGRVARALAGGRLLRAVSIPFLPLDGAQTVEEAGLALIDLLTSAEREGPALDRWRAEEAEGEAARRRLVPALAAALHRYAGRPSRRADLSAAVVTVGESVVVAVPPAVAEEITVDGHREGPVLLTAVGAGLRLEVVPGADIDGWLDRVVSTLALRVAAGLD